jgi:hypothetical protein
MLKSRGYNTGFAVSTFLNLLIMASYVNTQPGSITHSNFGPAPGSNEGVQGPVTIRTMRNDSTDCAFVANLGVEAFRDKFIHATSEQSYVQRNI